MKSFIKEKLNKIFLIMIIFILSICNFVYAEDEIPVSVDVYKSFEGWYKNWIMDFGAVRVTVRDSEGMLIEGLDFTVFPKQWEGKTEQKRKLNTEGANEQKDSKGREIFFMQKADGVIEFLNYINKDENGTVKYSDNIPQLAKRRDNSDNELPYAYFEEFSTFLTIDDWKNYNNGENVNKLADDLGITCHQASGLSFYDWCIQGQGSIELQPLCLHPEATEQIYCNDLNTAKEIGKFQYNSDFGDYLKALEELREEEETSKSWWEKAIDAATGFVKGIGETISAFIELKILAGQTFCDFFSSKIVYEDYGIIEFVEKEVKVLHQSGKDKYYTKTVSEKVFEPKYVLKTYTAATKYCRPWETNGWINRSIRDVGKYYTIDELKDIYYDDTHTLMKEKSGKAGEVKEVWHISFDDWFDKMCFVEKDGKYGHPKYDGFGEGSTIPEDHNKYTTIISGEGEYLQKLIANSATNKFDTATLPKYGAGLIPMTNTPGGLILMKFHSNLEQVGWISRMWRSYLFLLQNS